MISLNPFLVTKFPKISQIQIEGIECAPIMDAIQEAVSQVILLYLKQLYAKLDCVSSSLNVISLRCSPRLFTLAIIYGSLSTILTQQEHQVAVKYNPMYLNLKSLRSFSYPDLVSMSFPKDDSISIMLGIENVILKYKYLILFSMSQCPLCSASFVQAYQHAEHSYLICRECKKLAQKYGKGVNFIRFSLLSQSIDKQTIRINKRLTLYLSPFGRSVEVLFQQGLIDDFFYKPIYLSKSQTFTVSTQEGDSLDSENRFQQTKTEAFINKCQETAKKLSIQMQPYANSLLKTRETIVKSSITLKQKLINAKAQCKELTSDITAELPSIKNINFTMIKKGVGGLFGKLF